MTAADEAAHLFGDVLDLPALRAEAARVGLHVEGDEFVVYLVRWDGITLRRVSDTWATIYPSLECARRSVDVRGYPAVPDGLSAADLCRYLLDYRETVPAWDLETDHG